MEKYITKNGIKYELRGEQYYPMLEISEQINYEIGKYGHLHLDFIKKHRRGTYTTLLTEGHLNEHLYSIDEQAHEQIDLHISNGSSSCISLVNSSATSLVISSSSNFHSICSNNQSKDSYSFSNTVNQ